MWKNTSVKKLRCHSCIRERSAFEKPNILLLRQKAMARSKLCECKWWRQHQSLHNMHIGMVCFRYTRITTTNAVDKDLGAFLVTSLSSAYDNAPFYWSEVGPLTHNWKNKYHTRHGCTAFTYLLAKKIVAVFIDRTPPHVSIVEMKETLPHQECKGHRQT